MLARTFGCVRVVWNRTLAARHQRYATEGKGTSYAETDRALTLMKKTGELAFLNEVSSVPLQQTLRHQHRAFTVFFDKRARYPRFKSRHGRQSAHYTRAASHIRGGELYLAKTSVPLRFTWSWPDVDVAVLGPAMVIVTREPDGRWYVTFAVDVPDPEPLSVTGAVVGVDLGIKDFAATSDGEPAAPGTQGPEPGPLPVAPRPLPERLREPGQSRGQGCPRAPESPRRTPRLPPQDQHSACPRP